MRAYVLKLALVMVFGSIVAAAAVLPAGTELQVRLTSEVSSNKPSGQSIDGVIIAPVIVNGNRLLAAGARVSGTTSDVNAGHLADTDTSEQPATLRLNFTKINDGSGRSTALNAVVEGVDNARESVDTSGLITGIKASQTYESMLDEGLNKLSDRYSGLGQLLTGAKGAFLKKVDASIDYQPGVELTLKLTKPLDWTAPVPNPIGPITPQSAIAQLADAEPSRTVALSPPKPSDLTNLMFIGTQEQVEAAFKSAGWYPASELSRDSKLKTAQAIIEDRGYTEAPMSVLNLDGKPPDMTYQKTNNTFEQRHHIRIWRRPDQFNGKPVWVAAATHDTGFVFSKTSRNFTHGIDSHIDKERTKVLNDLLFTGLVHAQALEPRSSVVGADLSNATGDKLITDGQIAVVEF